MNLSDDDGRTYSLGECVEAHLKRTGHYSSKVERADDKADRCARVIGELVDLLATKGVLTIEEALKFTNHTEWNPLTPEE